MVSRYGDPYAKASSKGHGEYNFLRHGYLIQEGESGQKFGIIVSSAVGQVTVPDVL